jgi:hypothetical protein
VIGGQPPPAQGAADYRAVRPVPRSVGEQHRRLAHERDKSPATGQQHTPLGTKDVCNRLRIPREYPSFLAYAKVK